jgi:hypothetical protein
MPSNRNTIEIEGIFGTEVLGGFNIIRGFATLQELARISVPVLMEEPQADGAVTGHQRPLDEDHAEEVRRYFEQGDQRFIPEIILSVRLPMEKEELPPAGNFAPHQVGVRYHGSGIELRRKHKGKTLLNHILRVKVKDLPAIRQQQRIRRIDGNHRLAKAEQLAVVDGQVNRYKVPFCLLLLGDVGDVAHDYTEALVFHTINSTAKPLDGEFALKLILGQNPANSQPAHVEFAQAPALHLTRLLDASLRSLPEPNRSRLGGRPLARLSIASRELLSAYPGRKADVATLTQFRDEIVGALSDVCTHLHTEFQDFCRADYFLELASHVWMRSAGNGTHDQRMAETVAYLREMAKWMGSDGMRGLTTGKPLGKQMIEIYDAVRSRIPKKVFLARWYPTANDGEQLQRANNRLDALRELVESELHLQLIDMGTQEGGTFPIHEAMYQAILSSEIFIADLTGLRPNVMIELGYALHHMKTGRLLLLFNPIAPPADKVPFDTNTFRYEQINEAADIPGRLRAHLQEILEKAAAGEI